MKKKKTIKIIVAVLVCVLLISVVSIYSIPKWRVDLFVHTYHGLIEKAYLLVMAYLLIMPFFLDIAR